MSLSKPLPAIPPGRQSAELGAGHAGGAVTPSGHVPGKPFPARYTPTMGSAPKSGKISVVSPFDQSIVGQMILIHIWFSAL